MRRPIRQIDGRGAEPHRLVGWFAELCHKLRAPMIWAARYSRLRGRRREQRSLIARGDGYPYIAALRSPDLRLTAEEETPLLL